MKTTITNITGFADAFEAMYFSKRTWIPELANKIREICYHVENNSYSNEEKEEFDKMLGMALRMGKKHITILRYIDITIVTEGLHRGGQDDVDAHARRFDNRIIRNSTRLARFEQDEFSDYYKDKVITTDTMMKHLNVEIPQTIYELSNGLFYNERDFHEFMEEYPGQFTIVNTWIKSPNGYIKEKYSGNKDVARGLYMLGIPSNFISKINLTEWAHVFKERNKDGGANPEVKEWAEAVTNAICDKYPLITRDVVLSIEN